MNAMTRWSVCAVLALGLALRADAAADKIGVVQLEQLLKVHPDTAPAEAVLEKQREEFETERKDMLAEREKRKEAFEAARDEADNKALSDEAREEKIKVAQDRYVELREYERDLQDLQLQRQKELNDHGRRLRERIVVKIRTVIETYAQDEGYSLVLNTENAGMGAFGTVMYASDKVDITADIRALIVKQGSK